MVSLIYTFDKCKSKIIASVLLSYRVYYVAQSDRLLKNEVAVVSCVPIYIWRKPTTLDVIVTDNEFQKLYKYSIYTIRLVLDRLNSNDKQRRTRR